MTNGYNGKILHVDLSSMKMMVEEPDEVFYRTYLGGGGIASYYLLKGLKPGIDPFSPDNVLVFASNVISGVPIAGMTRYTVAAKSPLTGGFGEAEAGGFWGPELKSAGFDAVVITGKAAKPSYLWIHDGKVELRSAEKAWGLETGPAQEKIREEVKEKRARVAIIGPANVGKSTLFNRLTRSAQALVANIPGVTRDRHYASLTWDDRSVLLGDTGGLVGCEEELSGMVRNQAESAS